MLQNTELIECWRPCVNVTWPKCSGPPDSRPKLFTCLPNSVQYPGSSKVELGVNAPESSAAAAVTSLNDDPGRERSAGARVSSGAAPVHRAFVRLMTAKAC